TTQLGPMDVTKLNSAQFSKQRARTRPSMTPSTAAGARNTRSWSSGWLRMRRTAANPRWRSWRTNGEVATSRKTVRVSNPSARAASSSSSAGRMARNRPMSITWIRSSPDMLRLTLVPCRRMSVQLALKLVHAARVEKVVFEGVEFYQLSERMLELVRSGGEHRPPQRQTPLAQAGRLHCAFRPVLSAQRLDPKRQGPDQIRMSLALRRLADRDGLAQEPHRLPQAILHDP